MRPARAGRRDQILLVPVVLNYLMECRSLHNNLKSSNRKIWTVHSSTQTNKWFIQWSRPIKQEDKYHSNKQNYKKTAKVYSVFIKKQKRKALFIYVWRVWRIPTEKPNPLSFSFSLLFSFHSPFEFILLLWAECWWIYNTNATIKVEKPENPSLKFSKTTLVHRFLCLSNSLCSLCPTLPHNLKFSSFLGCWVWPGICQYSLASIIGFWLKVLFRVQ